MRCFFVFFYSTALQHTFCVNGPHSSVCDSGFVEYLLFSSMSPADTWLEMSTEEIIWLCHWGTDLFPAKLVDFLTIQPNDVNKANALRIKNKIICLGHNIEAETTVKMRLFF